MYFLFWNFNFKFVFKKYIIEMWDAAYVLRPSSQFRDCPGQVVTLVVMPIFEPDFDFEQLLPPRVEIST